MFGKDTGLSFADITLPSYMYFDLTKWVDSDNMNDDEKAEHPSHVTTGGFLRTYEYKEAWRNAWNRATQEKRAQTVDLPNFDADIFLDITGIDVRKELSDEVDITVEGVTKTISRKSAITLGLIEG